MSASNRQTCLFSRGARDADHRCTSRTPTPCHRRQLARELRLSKRAAFYLQASIILFFLAGSSAPTPLYAVYQARMGLLADHHHVVFGVYALAVLAALLDVGSLSDHVGRRPVLLAATLVQAVHDARLRHRRRRQRADRGPGDPGPRRPAPRPARSAPGMLDLDRVAGHGRQRRRRRCSAPPTGGLLAACSCSSCRRRPSLVYLVLGRGLRRRRRSASC